MIFLLIPNTSGLSSFCKRGDSYDTHPKPFFFSFRLGLDNLLNFIPFNFVLVSLHKFLHGFLLGKMGLNMLTLDLTFLIGMLLEGNVI